MLNPEHHCTPPVSALQPLAPLHTSRVPVVKFEHHLSVLDAEGAPMSIWYDVQHGVWMTHPDTIDGELLTQAVWLTHEGYWDRGTLEDWQAIRHKLPQPTEFRNVELPGYPVLPTDTQPIPREIHKIWIGTLLPSQNLIDALTRNGAHTAGYKVIVHTDVSDDLLIPLTQILKNAVPTLTIAPLNGTVFFEDFKKHAIYKHYLNISTGTTTNYSAASDILRYPLVNHYGGIYMDMDDCFTTKISEQVFMAASNDVLLGTFINAPHADFYGYNSSIFATHANNPVLVKVTEEMLSRCDKHKDFFIKPRPHFTGKYDSTYEALKTYSAELFQLTGPQVFNDVLARERPDYYGVLVQRSRSHGTKINPGVVDTAYFHKLSKVTDHYFPFFERARVVIGAEHSWITT